MTNDAPHTATRIARAYHGHAPEYAAINDDRSFAEPLLDALASHLPRAGIVADLGCGPGWETEALARRGLRAVGVDVTPDFLAFAARAHPAAGYVRGDFLALPFPGGALDGAWACSSLVHLSWARIDAALREIRRVLRPGGAFFASMQAGLIEGELPSATFPGERFHYAYYEPDDGTRACGRRGSSSSRWTTTAAPSRTATPAPTAGFESLAVRA